MSETKSCGLPMFATAVTCLLFGGAVGHLLGRQKGGDDARTEMGIARDEEYDREAAKRSTDLSRPIRSVGAIDASTGDPCEPPASTDRYETYGKSTAEADRITKALIARCPDRYSLGYFARVLLDEKTTSVSIRLCRHDRWEAWLEYSVNASKTKFAALDERTADACQLLEVGKMYPLRR